jgi:hypothetical protein
MLGQWAITDKGRRSLRIFLIAPVLGMFSRPTCQTAPRVFMGVNHIFAIYLQNFLQNGAGLVDNTTTRTIHFVSCIPRAVASSFGVELVHHPNVIAGGLAWRSDCTASRPVLLRNSYSHTSKRSKGSRRLDLAGLPRRSESRRIRNLCRSSTNGGWRGDRRGP